MLDEEQDADLSGMDHDETEQMAVFEETHAPGGLRAETTRNGCQHAGCRIPGRRNPWHSRTERAL